jgi:hypothetical protein
MISGVLPRSYLRRVELKRIYAKRYREKYGELIRIRHKKWLQDHEGKNTEYHRSWKSKMKNQNPEKWEKWMKAQRDRYALYKSKNVDYVKQKNRERLSRYYEEKRELINRSKMMPCKDCGIQYNPWIMQFDHLDPKNKKFTIGGGKISSFNLEEVREEISKCEVVCSNCHHNRTHKRKLPK